MREASGENSFAFDSGIVLRRLIRTNVRQSWELSRIFIAGLIFCLTQRENEVYDKYVV